MYSSALPARKFRADDKDLLETVALCVNPFLSRPTSLAQLAFSPRSLSFLCAVILFITQACGSKCGMQCFALELLVPNRGFHFFSRSELLMQYRSF